MSYLYRQAQLNNGDVVEIELDKQANIRLLDGCNYNRYRNDESYKYYGGLAVKSPVRLSPPYPGCWHVVVDLEGYIGSVNASINILRAN